MVKKHSEDKHKKKHKEKSKKRKKEKKYKKHKKEKSKHRSDSTDSESSNSEDNLNEKLKREPTKPFEWGFLDTILSDSHVTVKEKPEKVKRPSPERPGQNIRELNPYWKDGGSGLPPMKDKIKEEEPSSSSKYSNSNKFKSDFEGSKSHSRIDFGCSNKQSKPNFLKPGEDTNFKLNSNTFQRNWKKKEVKEPETENPEPKVNSGNVESVTSPKTLSNEELNKLASKLVKAEIMGNTNLVNKLKAELEAAKKAKEETEKGSSKEKTKEVVIVTDRGLKKSHDGKQSHGSSKRQKVNTHDVTGRVCYFPDDDKYSLKNLFEKAKEGREEDILLPSKLAGKNPDELDDIYLEAAASNKVQEKMEEKKNKKAMKEAVIKHKTLEGCRWCLDNRNDTKHLIITTGSKCYMCLPEEESLTTGHCLIVPLQHEISALHLDEDVWSEIKTYQRVLTQMFLQQEKDVVFFENARSFKHFPHCVIHCVPLDKEMGDVAPIYFQKAISESETEWSSNKKVVDFRQKDLRRCIPKGLPYFSVSFGTEGGFAHIIEDEYLFKKNFAEEVLGGMLDLDPRKWRKPHKEQFRAQREKALEFLKIWKDFEFNENSSDSETSSSE